jgi:hypothetical protein
VVQVVLAAVVLVPVRKAPVVLVLPIQAVVVAVDMPLLLIKLVEQVDQA